MSKKLTFYVLIAGALSVASTLARAENKAQLHYLTPNAIDIATAVPPAPRPGSKRDIAELNQIRQLAKTRTEQDCERARSEEDATLKNFFGAPYGPLSDSQVEILGGFFKKIGDDAHFFNKEEKDFQARPRPYFEDPSLPTCVKRDPAKKARNGSYPSTHTTFAYVYADVLSVLYPESREAFQRRADQIAFDRVLGGAHHESDVLAGRQMGHEIFEALESSQRFQHEMMKIEKEIR